MKNLIFNIYKTLFFFDLSLILFSVIPDIKTGNPAILTLWREAVPLMIIILFSIFFIRFVERRKIRIPVSRYKFKKCLNGIVCGILLIAPAIALMFVLKTLTFSGSNKISYLPVWIIAVLFSTITHELLIRGYLYQLYRKYYSVTTVVIVNTILFISLNLKIFSPGTNGIIYAVNMLAINVVLCLLLEFSNNIIIPVAAHFSYNIISSLIMGSLKLKGDYPFMFNITYAGNKYLSGGDLKLEGGICLLIVELIFIFILIYKLRKRSRSSTSRSQFSAM